MQREKNVLEFNKGKATKDGYHYECRKCQSRENKEHYKLHKVEKQQYLKNNKIRINIYQKKKQQEYKISGTRRQYNNARLLKWIKNNAGIVNARNSKRRANIIKRMPAWADLKAIKRIYINCPQGMQVDHIIPLQGKTVSGFHVEYNLQYLSPEDNMKKGNRWPQL